MSTEVQSTGVGYIGIGVASSYMLTYVTGIKFSGNDKDYYVADGILIPKASIDILDTLINYMKSNPDPNKKPDLGGVKFVTWSELYP